MAMIEMAWRN